MDKSKWGPGPWQTEPDELHFICHGLQATIKRHAYLGTLAGYIKISKDYEGVRNRIDVHGGITFDDGETIGFDCLHAGDFAPGFPMLATRCLDSTYRDIEFVKKEIDKMAIQIKLWFMA